MTATSRAAVSRAPADDRHRGGGGARRRGRVFPARVQRGDGGVGVAEREVEQALNGVQITAARQPRAHPAVDGLGSSRRCGSTVAMAAGAVENPVERGRGIDQQPVLVTMRPPAHTDDQFVGRRLDQPERELQRDRGHGVLRCQKALASTRSFYLA